MSKKDYKKEETGWCTTQMDLTNKNIDRKENNFKKVFSVWRKRKRKKQSDWTGRQAM